MSELSQQQVKSALQGILNARPRAEFEGNETQSYLRIPYAPQDQAVLARILPKLIRDVDHVTIDPRTHTLHFRFTTPEGYDSNPQQQPSSAEVQERIRQLQNDPKAYERALKEAMRDDGEDEREPAYGQRAAGDFFALVERNATNPRALTASVNAGESQESKFEACMDQYYQNRPATDTIQEVVQAQNVCRVKANEGTQR